MDEGIGAGDQFFLEKVKKRANSFILGANILFLASHSPMLLRDVCNKALVLDGGRIIGAGDLEDMLDLYAGMEIKPSKTVFTDINDPNEPPPTMVGKTWRKKVNIKLI